MRGRPLTWSNSLCSVCMLQTQDTHPHAREGDNKTRGESCGPRLGRPEPTVPPRAAPGRHTGALRALGSGPRVTIGARKSEQVSELPRTAASQAAFCQCRLHRPGHGRQRTAPAALPGPGAAAEAVCGQTVWRGQSLSALPTQDTTARCRVTRSRAAWASS